jgi:hypothetical protein
MEDGDGALSSAIAPYSHKPKKMNRYRPTTWHLSASSVILGLRTLMSAVHNAHWRISCANTRTLAKVVITTTASRLFLFETRRDRATYHTVASILSARTLTHTKTVSCLHLRIVDHKIKLNSSKAREVTVPGVRAVRA